MKEKDINSLAHTKWRCQYHVVFAPKYRRMVVYGEIKKDIGEILRRLCDQKGVEIVEAEACPDYKLCSFFKFCAIFKIAGTSSFISSS